MRKIDIKIEKERVKEEESLTIQETEALKNFVVTLMENQKDIPIDIAAATNKKFFELLLY